MTTALGKPIAALLLLLGLAGCAQNQAFEQGKTLIEQGKTEEGLNRLEQSVKEAPDRADYRSYLARQRELVVSRTLAEADMAREAGQWEAAEAAYRRTLRLEPHNPRAMAGLDALAKAQRHAQLLQQATASLQKDDHDGAAALLRPILIENPKHAGALALQRSIEEKRSPPAGGAPTLLAAALRKPIDLDFRDANIRTVFSVISRMAGINFIFDRDVRSDLRVNIAVRNTAIEDAVRLLLATHQLEQKPLNDNTILIYPNQPAKTREYQDLVVRSFFLANTDAKQALNLIKTIVKTKDVFIDERLNMLVMRDTPEAIALAERLINTQDAADPEVMLELEVLEVSRNRLQELGIRYPEQVSAGIVGAPSVAGTAGVAGRATLSELKNFNSDLVRITVTDPALILNLKKTDTDANLLANPRIRVKNREKAKIHIGEKVPVITTTSTANVGISESVAYLDVGLKLDIEPNIYLDGEVAIKMGLEVSNILEKVTSPTGTQTYRLGTRNTSTTLRLKDNETQVLAGLIQDDDRKTANKVPGLGDLPLLGRLFSSYNDSKTKTEIILLITPRVVRNIVRPELPSASFYSGTEATIGAPPLSLKRAAVVAMAASPLAMQAATDTVPSARMEPTQPSLGLNLPGQAALETEFQVTIDVNAPAEIKQASFDLVYDPALLYLVNAEEAAFMKQGGARTDFSRNEGASPGRVTLQLVRPSGRKGSGPLATATFRVTAQTPGATIIAIENASVTDAGGSPQAATVPGPASLVISP